MARLRNANESGQEAPARPSPPGDGQPPPGVNEVVLVGTLTADPETVSLPSGAELVRIRVSVRRAPSPMTTGSKQSVDWVDCAAWGGRVRRVCRAWAAGDRVEVRGALRRRYLRGSAAPGSRVEVEILAGKRLRPAAGGARQSAGAEVQ